MLKPWYYYNIYTLDLKDINIIKVKQVNKKNNIYIV